MHSMGQSYHHTFLIDTPGCKTAERARKMITADPATIASQTADQQVLHPGSRMLFRHWEALRAEKAFPSRRQIHLGDVKSLIPQLFILEPDRNASTFRFRLSGTGIDHLWGTTLTGTSILDGWDSFERDVIYRTLRVAHENYQPALIRLRLFTELGDIVGGELLALPVERNDRRGIELFGGLFPFTDVSRMAVGRVTSRQLVTTRTIWTEHLETSESAPMTSRQPFRVIDGGLSK
jgi:hypothetical protein